jgi:hypothetical protein
VSAILKALQKLEGERRAARSAPRPEPVLAPAPVPRAEDAPAPPAAPPRPPLARPGQPLVRSTRARSVATAAGLGAGALAVLAFFVWLQLPDSPRETAHEPPAAQAPPEPPSEPSRLARAPEPRAPAPEPSEAAPAAPPAEAAPAEAASAASGPPAGWPGEIPYVVDEEGRALVTKSVTPPAPASPEPQAAADSESAPATLPVARQMPREAEAPLAEPAAPERSPHRSAPPEPAPAPARAASAAKAAAPARRAPRPARTPDVALIPAPPRIEVERTRWHPTPERRVALVRVEGHKDALELREGDAVGTLVVAEIEPSGVVFLHGGERLQRRVGAAR